MYWSVESQRNVEVLFGTMIEYIDLCDHIFCLYYGEIKMSRVSGCVRMLNRLNISDVISLKKSTLRWQQCYFVNT